MYVYIVSIPLDRFQRESSHVRHFCDLELIEQLGGYGNGVTHNRQSSTNTHNNTILHKGIITKLQCGVHVTMCSTFIHWKHVPHIRTCTHAVPMVLSGYWCTDYTMSENKKWESVALQIIYTYRTHWGKSHSHSLRVSPEPRVQLILHVIFSHSGHTRKVAIISPPQCMAPQSCHALLVKSFAL